MKDQYLKAHDLFDSENNRFWTRFNIFTGLQLAIMAAFVSNYSSLSEFKFMSILSILTAMFFSIFTMLVTHRSFQVNVGMSKAIEHLEENDETLILLKTYLKNCKAPLGGIVRYCFMISVILFVFWVIFFVKIIFDIF